MRKLLFVAVLGLFSVASAHARDCSSFDAAGGYNYVRVNSTIRVFGTGAPVNMNLNGWDAEASANVACWLAVVGQFSGVYGSETIFGTPVKLHVYPYVFGPRFNYHNSTHFTPFVEALFGGAHSSVTPQGFTTATQNAFSSALGVGVDYKASERFSIRLIEADDLITRFGSQTQHNARIGAGIVFHFGGS
jgi:opacity protein-like surface antigen